MTDPTYALGRSDDEYARLTEQANFLRPLTERFFKKAGIAPGMKVLDVGSGVGDVAFLLAELVGLDGKVVGVDMDGAALEKARKRAEQLKLRNVEFLVGDIRTAALPGPFDAAVGRLVLLYCADPAAALARHRDAGTPQWDRGISGNGNECSSGTSHIWRFTAGKSCRDYLSNVRGGRSPRQHGQRATAHVREGRAG